MIAMSFQQGQIGKMLFSWKGWLRARLGWVERNPDSDHPAGTHSCPISPKELSLPGATGELPLPPSNRSHEMNERHYSPTGFASQPSRWERLLGWIAAEGS